jgi:hypothetical protein
MISRCSFFLIFILYPSRNFLFPFISFFPLIHVSLAPFSSLISCIFLLFLCSSYKWMYHEQQDVYLPARVSKQRSTDHTCLQVFLQGEHLLLLLIDNDDLSCKVTGRHTCKSVLRLLLVTSRTQNWFKTSSTDLFIRKQNLTGMKMRSLWFI